MPPTAPATGGYLHAPPSQAVPAVGAPAAPGVMVALAASTGAGYGAATAVGVELLGQASGTGVPTTAKRRASGEGTHGFGWADVHSSNRVLMLVRSLDVADVIVALLILVVVCGHHVFFVFFYSSLRPSSSTACVLFFADPRSESRPSLVKFEIWVRRKRPQGPAAASGARDRAPSACTRAAPRPERSGETGTSTRPTAPFTSWKVRQT